MMSRETEQSRRKKKKRSRLIRRILQGVSLLLCFLGCLLLTSTWWMMRTWPVLRLAEVLFQLRNGVEGTSTDIILEYILTGFLPALILPLLLWIAFRIVRRKRRYTIRLIQLTLLAAAFSGILAVLLAWNHMDIGNYLKNKNMDSTFIEENYVDPAAVTIRFPEKKRNLIYIYLESMESSFTKTGRGGCYEEDYIAELVDLANANVNFSAGSGFGGVRMTEYATWTMGGLFAESSGLPLVTDDTDQEHNATQNQDSFLPGLTCLGDILESAGYRQAFLCGSDAVFGGRSTFFTDHGSFELDDYYWALDQNYFDKDYYVWWGLEDEKLFAYAKDILADLAASDQPFNLTMLTVDTHSENGYVCRLCESRFDEQYANVLACSSRQVTSFIRWASQQPWYENTTIILAGDHLTKDKDFAAELNSSERGVYNCFINSAVSPVQEKNREATTLDLFPSTLGALGCQIEGDRLGLGTNLFADARTLAEQVGFDTMNQEFSRKSEFMERLTGDLKPEFVETEDGKWIFYIREEKRYAKSEWIDYKPYKLGYPEVTRFYIDEDGYAVFGWLLLDGEWYYIDYSFGLIENPEEMHPEEAAVDQYTRIDR